MYEGLLSYTTNRVQEAMPMQNLLDEEIFTQFLDIDSYLSTISLV